MKFFWQLAEYGMMPAFMASFIADKCSFYFETKRLTGPNTPVLLLHGKSANRAQWALPKRWLEEQGVQSVFCLNYVLTDDNEVCHFSTPRDASLEDLVTYVAEEVADICQRTNSEKIIIIGHSMGGVVAALAAEKYCPGMVEKVVTLGSPFLGSPLVSFLDRCTQGYFTSYFSSSKVMKEMARLPGHEKLMQELCASIERNDKNIQYMFVGGDVDYLVEASHAAPKRASSAGYVYVGHPSGHYGYVFPNARSLWIDKIIPFVKTARQPLSQES